MSYCKECGNEFKASSQRKYFCCLSCYKKWKRNNIIFIKENHPNWKGGEEKHRERVLKKHRDNTKIKQDKIGYWSTGEKRTKLVNDIEIKYNINIEEYLYDLYYNKEYSTRDIAKSLGLSNRCIIRWMKLKMKLSLREQSTPSERMKTKQSINIKKNKLSSYKKPTKEEQYVIDKLTKKYKIKSNFNITINGFNFFLDIAIPDKKIDIEIDGEEHRLKKKKEYDKTRKDLLALEGWRTFRIMKKTILKRAKNDLQDIT